MHTRRTLTLTPKWDICLDPSGYIALTNGAIATAQNVANEARLFTNDAYFQQDKGTPFMGAWVETCLFSDKYMLLGRNR